MRLLPVVPIPYNRTHSAVSEVKMVGINTLSTISKACEGGMGGAGVREAKACCVWSLSAVLKLYDLRTAVMKSVLITFSNFIYPRSVTITSADLLIAKLSSQDLNQRSL